MRRLTNDEHPLLVQLNWSKLDREGKFLLKLETTVNEQTQVSLDVFLRSFSPFSWTPAVLAAELDELL